LAHPPDRHFGILLAIAGTFGAWLGGKLDDKLWADTRDISSLLMLLLSVIAFCWWTRFDPVRQGRSPEARRRLFSVRRSAPIWCWILIAAAEAACRRPRARF